MDEEIEEISKENVTYEEWLKATRFGRFRYKYGLIVLIACWISLLLLIYFVIHYAKELSTNPAEYILDKIGTTDCYCYSQSTLYYFNRTILSTTSYSLPTTNYLPIN